MATPGKEKKKLSPITWILIGIVILMVVLILLVTAAIDSITAKNSRNNMQTIAAQRSKVITDYVGRAEDTLDYFAYAGQIRDFLQNPDDAQLRQIAQKLTTDYAEDVGELEGLYIADWNSYVLTHSNPETIGITIREGDRLNQLHEALDAAGDGVYTSGILMSPSSNNQVISMYKAIRDDSGKPLGFVGLALLTDRALSDLSDLKLGGLENAEYLLLNAPDNMYLYCDDKSQIGTICDLPDITNITADVLTGAAPEEGDGQFKNAEGKKVVSVYHYMKDYQWLLLVNAPYSEVYAMGAQLSTFVSIIGLLMICLLIGFALVNAHQEKVNRKLGIEIAKNEATEASLQTALFKDILTEVQNRVAFSEDLDKVQADADHPCYFVMFDISELSVINTQFGNDTGDIVLCNTANELTKAFPDGTVYRTGDDEFIVAIQKSDNSTASYNQIFREINDAHSALLRPQQGTDGVVSVSYKVAFLRTTSDLSTTIVSVLKDMVNRSGRTAYGQANFLDMDNM